MNGRHALSILILLILALIGLSFRFYGYEATWRFWNIPTLMPPFIDLRHLTGSAESYHAGLNPGEENPGDPLGRLFNLPVAWYLFFYAGIEQDDTMWIGALLAAGYLFCSWVFPRRTTLPAAVLITAVLFSPASMLAMERGNVDLFIFLLCTLALILLTNHTWLAAAMLTIASFLKLFPVVAVSIFLCEKRSRFWTISLSVFTIFLTYAVLSFSSISASLAHTEVGAGLSYGVNVIPLYLQQVFASEQLFNLLTPIFSLLGLGLFLIAFFRGGSAEPLPAYEERNLSAFRLGAMIYAGTFFIGNNWDYRLIFLIFTVPQLVEWSMGSSARQFARWTLAFLIIACWYLIHSALFGALPMGEHIAFLIDQISKWGLFVSAGYLFFASAPDWLKLESRQAFAFRKQTSA